MKNYTYQIEILDIGFRIKVEASNDQEAETAMWAELRRNVSIREKHVEAKTGTGILSKMKNLLSAII